MPKKPRRIPLTLRSGSLRGLGKRQLNDLKTEIDRQWAKDNPRVIRARGRPNTEDLVYAACDRTKQRMLHKAHATLSDWYRAVENDLKTHAVTLSRPTLTKFVRQWLESHLLIDDLPDGLGPYLINKRKDFRTVQWIVLWGSLCRRFSEISSWLSSYKQEHGAVIGELPHAILPTPLQTMIARHFDAPLGPRLYDRLVREALRKAPEK